MYKKCSKQSARRHTFNTVYIIQTTRLAQLQTLPVSRVSHVALHKTAGARCAKETRTKIAEGAQSAAGGGVTEASLYATRSVSHTRMNTNLSRLRSP